MTSGRDLHMTRPASRRRHIAALDNPVNGRMLPSLAVIEELVRRGHQVTYVTSAEVAARLTLLDAVTDSWSAVGILDDSTDPVACVRGYFGADRPDLLVYRTNTCLTAQRLLTGWDMPAFHLTDRYPGKSCPGSVDPLDLGLDDFLARHRLCAVPHERSRGPCAFQ